MEKCLQIDPHECERIILRVNVIVCWLTNNNHKLLENALREENHHGVSSSRNRYSSTPGAVFDHLNLDSNPSFEPIHHDNREGSHFLRSPKMTLLVLNSRTWSDQQKIPLRFNQIYSADVASTNRRALYQAMMYTVCSYNWQLNEDLKLRRDIRHLVFNVLHQ